jgi:hypothetical protein
MLNPETGTADLDQDDSQGRKRLFEEGNNVHLLMKSYKVTECHDATDVCNANSLLGIFKAKMRQFFQKSIDYHYQSSSVATARSPSRLETP